ncbi:MAG: class I SAM-dependent methyltransferase [Spirochaetales bacterium]|nr:class I SAM-dependent methyltransferase [Spirochaetales bacterium]
MTEEKLKKFAKHLKKKHGDMRKWALDSGIEAYRVYNRDMGDIPLAIDFYGKYLHVTLFESNNKETFSPEEMDLLVETAGKNLYVPEERIFVKTRELLTGGKQYGKYKAENITERISEYGLNFKVNLSDYIDTGLFLDHRDTRQLVRENSSGKRVLNLFAYTGSFSVYAAAGGAASTTSVDLSNVYLNWARENMELNNFTAASHKYENSDVFAFLEEAAQKKESWDLIILDPPTFSNSRKMKKVLDIQKDHLAMINHCLSLLTKNGILIFSTNFTKFRIDPAVRENGFVHNISDETIPEDFKGSKIHKCWIIEKRR